MCRSKALKAAHIFHLKPTLLVWYGVVWDTNSQRGSVLGLVGLVIVYSDCMR